WHRGRLARARRRLERPPRRRLRGWAPRSGGPLPAGSGRPDGRGAAHGSRHAEHARFDGIDRSPRRQRGRATGRPGCRSHPVMGIAVRVRAAFAASSGPHETRGASVMRPVVFGATDGLVCNLSLIMGVAAAASEDPHAVVIAGVAGLLAGSFSMAVGEYVSVRSQHELLEYQVELQREQLIHTPDQERTILTGIYIKKGLTRAEAELIVE